MANDTLMQEADARFIQSLPGYPFLPCPICKGTEGCDHTVPERMRAAGVNWQSSEITHEN